MPPALTATQMQAAESRAQDMTLRDYFAAQALAALITVQLQTKQPQSAATAYEWADAMLEARNA